MMKMIIMMMEKMIMNRIIKLKINIINFNNLKNQKLLRRIKNFSINKKIIRNKIKITFKELKF